jgi:hypothetical protein
VHRLSWIPHLVRPSCDLTLCINTYCKVFLRFGEGLEVEEQLWLVGAVNMHLEELRGGEAVDVGAMPLPEEPRVVRDDNSANP